MSRQEKEHQKIIQYLHDLLLSYDGVTVKLRFGIPFYDRRKWLCYLNPTKEKNIEIVFCRGSELSNKQGLLESRGRKQVSGIRFISLKSIPKNALKEIIAEAIALDEFISPNVKIERKN